MNNFTLENTKDATHAVWVESSNDSTSYLVMINAYGPTGKHQTVPYLALVKVDLSTCPAHTTKPANTGQLTAQHNTHRGIT